MKREILQKIEIPEGVEATIEGHELTVKGKKGENKRKFSLGRIKFEKKGGEIILEDKKATKKEKKIINTTASHIENMIKGVQEGFEYKLKICISHFPITVEIGKGEAIVKNFLGEKIPRKVKIPKNVDASMEKDIITVSSVDKEAAGQAAANFEKSTRIRNRDRRIFQDGIFIISKAGREI